MKRRRKNLFIAVVGIVIAVGLGYFLYQSMDLSSQPSTGEAVEFDTSGQPILGNPNASVTVVEFADYKCPACAQFHSTAYQNLKQEYIDTGEVRFVFMQFPFLAPDSQTAAMASECMLEQDEDAFWSFHDAIYNNQGPEPKEWATIDRLLEIARDSTDNVDYEQLRACIKDGDTLSDVQSDLSTGQQAGVPATPAVFVNGQLLERWRFSTLQTIIEEELEK